MIIDSSALVAVLLKEPEALRHTNAIADSSGCKVPASCFLESSMLLLGRSGDDALRDLDLLRDFVSISSLSQSSKRVWRARLSNNLAKAATPPN